VHRWPAILAFAAFALILGVPFAMRSGRPPRPRDDVPRLIIITPHVRQISEEFTQAFKAWYRAQPHADGTGGEVEVDWRGPFGTSEIVKLLQAQYTAAMRRELDRLARESPDTLLDPAFTLDAAIHPGDIGFDLFFGGGSFDHSRVKARETASVAVPVLPRGGVQKVALSKIDRIDPANLHALREVRADVALPNRKPLRLTIPLAAIEGGLAAVEPLALNPPEATLTVDTSRLTRDFGVVMAAKAGLTPEELAPLGDGLIGSERTYDPDQYWIGTALSSFGIVFNRELCEEAGFRDDPTTFADLANPNLQGLVALADPRQSGSLTTAIDMILSSNAWRAGAAGGWGDLLAQRGGLEKAMAAGHGPEIDEAWRRSWRTLREISANARYYASSSTKPPIDVSQGEAAAGLAIDFYGKAQAQAILRPGEDPATSRVGYADPIGETNFDADPVTILHGGPSFKLAQAFVRFCLSREAQALWQFPANRPGVTNPRGADGRPMGPAQYELRRLPIRKDMYEDPYYAHFIDKVRPFDRAPKAKPVGWRDAIAIMMPAFSVDVLDDQRRAWADLNKARRDDDFPRAALAEMERAFYSFPTTSLADGRTLEFTPKDFPALAAAWRDARKNGRLKQDFTLAYTRFFKDAYRRVSHLAVHPEDARPDPASQVSPSGS
jgi:ABC-type Fe3+ transport system substrate-binding protein